MPQSLSRVLVHVVLSTKNREPLIRGSIERELHAYGTTVLKNDDCPALAMNGTADHIHALIHLSRTRSIADVLENLKTSTSKWIKTKARGYRGFHWQNGYAAFSVSQSSLDRTIKYIRKQKEHHLGRSFQVELRALLEKHQIPYDERYVWDRSTSQVAPLGLTGPNAVGPSVSRGVAPGYCRLGLRPTGRAYFAAPERIQDDDRVERSSRDAVIDMLGHDDPISQETLD